MTAEIKLPPFPEGLCLREDIEDYAREAVRLNATVPDEPNWRHPKIQGLIGSEARLRITIDLIWRILENPNDEFGPSDMEYWDTIHDKLKEALSTESAQQPLTDEKCDAIYRALDSWARGFDEYEFGLPQVCGGGGEGGREVIRHALRNRSQE
jgi:hypothetical protein